MGKAKKEYRIVQNVHEVYFVQVKVKFLRFVSWHTLAYFDYLDEAEDYMEFQKKYDGLKIIKQDDLHIITK